MAIDRTDDAAAGTGTASPHSAVVPDRGAAPLDRQVDAQAALLEEYLDTKPDADVHVLRPLAALGEVVAVCESLRAGREAPQPRDRRSLQADVQLSLTSLGDELKRELQPAWHDFFHHELAALPELLAEPGGVVRLLAATRALIARLRRPACAQAIWRDLLAQVAGGADPEQCRLRALQLRELEEGLGHEWIWRGWRLRELARGGDFAGSEDVLSMPPSRAAQVAWFIFANADIPDGYLRVGQVQFFSHRLWPAAVTSREFIAQFPDAEWPAELDEHALNQLTPSDGAEAHVYARVELTGPRAAGARNPWAHGRPPGAWARELVSTIVEAATFRIGGSNWKLLSGTAIYAGQVSDASGTFGNWGGSFGFADPAVFEASRRFVAPLREGTGEALESLDARFAELLAENDATANDAVTEVRWYDATRRQTDPAQRVVLHVRAFERALPLACGEHWHDAVKRYFREFWALDCFDRELFELAHASELIIRRHALGKLERLEQWLVRDGEQFTIALGLFLRAAPSIVSLVPREYRLERRALRQVVKRASDPGATRAQLELLEHRFDILLARALRQRNAVVHGIKTVNDVVASVDGFLARVAAYVVAQAVYGAGLGEDVVEALERSRERSQRALWRLNEGHAPVHRVLYGADEDEM